MKFSSILNNTIKYFIFYSLLFIFISTANSIDISNCTNLSSSGSTYNLISDINTSANNCLNLNTNNVTLDCQGHYLFSINANLIHLQQGFSNNTIKNCNLNGSYHGIYVYLNNNNNLLNLNITNTTVCINLEDSSNNTITNVNCWNNDYGIYLGGTSDGANNNTILNSNISVNNLYNIFFDASTTTTDNNTFYNNYLGDGTMIDSTFTFDSNHNNYFSYNGVGNYWQDMPTCTQATLVNEVYICTNPANYTINAGLNIYDISPVAISYIPEVSSLDYIFPIYGIKFIIVFFGILISHFIFS